MVLVTVPLERRQAGKGQQPFRVSPQVPLLSKTKIWLIRYTQASHAEHTVTSYNLAKNYVCDVNVGGLSELLKTFSDTGPLNNMLNWQIEKGTYSQIPETLRKDFHV